MHYAQFPRPDEAPARLRRKPSWLINKISVQAHRRIAEVMTAAGGRAHHFAILSALEEFGPASQMAIGQRCGIDRSDMHAMVNELADQGLVVRSLDQDDRRRNIITITPAGQQRLAELDLALSDVQEDLFSALSEEERDQLIALLTRVAAAQAGLSRRMAQAQARP
jgi:DNA-binding MarR family transcriptional regulator